MSANQVQIRRGTTAENDAFTGQDGEITFDNQRDQIRTHDGATAGGFPVLNAGDIQNGTATAGTTGGSANAQTLTVTPAISAYATGQLFWFKAGATNTGSTTLNISAVGAKTIKRVVQGSKQNLAGGEITSGRVYVVIYDGTDLVLLSPDPPLRFESSNQTITSGAEVQVAHGLGVKPWSVGFLLVCTDAGGDAGYAQGDEVQWGTYDGSERSNRFGFSAQVDSTNITIRFTSNSTVFRIADATSGVSTNLTNSKWALIVRAEV